MKNAFRIGLRAGIRTFAQSEAGALSAITVTSIASGDLKILGVVAGVGTMSALISAVVAFLMNFSENIPEETVEV